MTILLDMEGCAVTSKVAKALKREQYYTITIKQEHDVKKEKAQLLLEKYKIHHSTTKKQKSIKAR